MMVSPAMMSMSVCGLMVIAIKSVITILDTTTAAATQAIHSMTSSNAKTLMNVCMTLMVATTIVIIYRVVLPVPAGKDFC